MAKFAKVFDLENGEQVLVTACYDPIDEDFKLKMQTEFDGCTMATTEMAFDEGEEAMDVLHGFTMEKARAFRDDMLLLFD